MSSSNLELYVRKVLLESVAARHASKGWAVALDESVPEETLVLVYDAKAAIALAGDLQNASQTVKRSAVSSSASRGIEIFISGVRVSKHTVDKAQAREVTASVSVQGTGAGPLAYEAALALLGPLTPDSKEVSKSARAVWSKFAERQDIKTRKLSNINDATQTATDWIGLSYELTTFPAGLSEMIAENTKTIRLFKNKLRIDIIKQLRIAFMGEFFKRTWS